MDTRPSTSARPLCYWSIFRTITSIRTGPSPRSVPPTTQLNKTWSPTFANCSSGPATNPFRSSTTASSSTRAVNSAAATLPSSG